MTLQTKADYINNKLLPKIGGDTPLIDIQTNQSDPLVNLVTTVLAGDERVERKLAFLKSGLFASDVEGEYLDLVAQIMGTTRRLDLPSKAPIIVVGTNGRVLESGTVLVDNKGNEWTTLDTAVICDSQGFTTACSPVGRFELDNGELRLKDSVQGIDFATNSAQPILGGEFENDESLRARLLNYRPQWKIKGTKSALEAELSALDGVFEARAISKLPDCLNDDCAEKLMISVLGGDDEEIAQAIYDNAPFSIDRLVGGTSVTINCNDVKFQRMCPVQIKIKYWLSCDCPNIEDIEAFENGLSDYLNKLSLSSRDIGVGTIASYDKRIIKVEMSVIPRPLGDISEDCLSDSDTFDNPITGEEDEIYTTDDPNSYCWIGDAECQETASCIDLKDWMYAIFLTDNIEQGSGCPCPSNDGCGCANS